MSQHGVGDVGVSREAAPALRRLDEGGGVLAGRRLRVGVAGVELGKAVQQAEGMSGTVDLGTMAMP